MSTTDAQFEAGDQLPANESGKKHRGRSRRPDAKGDGIHHTRIGRAWVTVAVAAVLGVALIDFIVQNTRSVRVEFFGASGQMPVAVALLGAALAGAFLILAVGISRTTQLRIATRRGKKRQERAEAPASHPER